MSRLDRQVAQVKGKLTLERFLLVLGVTLAVFAGAVAVAIVVDRTFHLGLPRPKVWFWSAAGATVVAALAYTVVRRPTSHQAAVLIDQKLGLDEKFSTALYARQAAAKAGGADPFAAAAVTDAERTADNVSLSRRFPVAFPNTGYWAIGLAVAAAVTAQFYPQLDLFHREAAKEAAAANRKAASKSLAVVQQALAKVDSQPAAVQAKQDVQLAKAELQRKLQNPPTDPSDSKLSAMQAQQAIDAARQEELKTSQQYAQATTNDQLFKTLNPGADDKGPASDVAKDMAAGEFAAAAEKMASLPTQFNQMKPEEQKRTAEQMDKLADDLKKLANDPAVQQHLQQTLQQNGVSQQQAKQIADLARQAAGGNQQAQQQLQNMQQQVMKQMNNGQGPTQQQQQQIQQAAKQMQAAAGTQQQAGQMSAAASAMAQAMSKLASAQAVQQGGAKAGSQQAGAAQGTMTQAAGGQQQANAGQKPGQQPGGQKAGGQQQANGGQKPGGQQQGSQQGGSQATGGQQPGGQQPGGQQPGGQQPGGQQAGGQQAGGQQPGGAGGGQTPQQQMADAQQQMKDALDQMDAVKHDADQQAAAGQQNGGEGNGNQGQGGQPGDGGNGQGGQGNPGNQAGPGMGGPGIGQGGVGAKTAAPYTVQASMDPSQRIANGKVLARSYIKAPTDKGEAKIEFTPAAAAAYNKETDEVNEESIPKDAQKVVKDYFQTTQSGQ